MSVFEDELTLPGAITEIISEYDLGYDTSLFGTTDSVVVIGTAFNGPVGKPVEIYSPEYAAYVFGDSYDYTARREATLTAEIQNAWDRGCRTIYGVRISGKEIYKDFELVPETKLRLRVSGLFPSNLNKNIYMFYDNTEGAEMIKIYKPATRATIAEKKGGKVDNINSVMTIKFDLANTYGFTKDSRLVELLNVLNDSKTNNNVLRFTIVDENGNDVTISSKEAQALSIGAIFPGAYFIGRDKNLGISYTDVQYNFVVNGVKPYDTFTDNIYKQLVINTDINADFPIYAASKEEYNAKLPVPMAEVFDFLEVLGKVDEVFAPDDIDYEEVDLSSFDVYKKLGSGYAITAQAIVDKTPQGNIVIKKVKETPTSDPNRIQPITDGIYSMLQNLKSEYRVLTCGTADEVITGKIPRKTDFKIAVSKSTKIKDLVTVESIVDKKDFSEAKAYTFTIKEIDNDIDSFAIQADTYTNKTAKAISLIDNSEIDMNTSIPEGSILTDGEFICRVTDGVIQKLKSADNQIMKENIYATAFNTTDPVSSDPVQKYILYKVSVSDTFVKLEKATATDIDSKKYIFVSSNKTVFVYEAKDGTELELIPIGNVDEIFNDNDDKTLISIQSEYGMKNTIQIQSTEFDYLTLEEFVELLNEDVNLGAIFKFSLTQNGVINKDELVEELLELVDPLTADKKTFSFELAKDKELTYDTSLYIPYKTTDNFARQLAQHCTYTALKTDKTHGIIGCDKLRDTSLTSIANKVSRTLAKDLNLVAKKANGKDILDQNNIAYPIGRNVSVVFGSQYIVNCIDGNQFISNGAAGYAGMVSCLSLEQSSTNQPINIPTPMYELTNSQLTSLSQAGYITFKNSYTKGIVVTDGVTMAEPTSEYKRLSVTRIMGAIERILREASEPFIGKQNDPKNRNAMRTAIKAGLESIKGTLIEDYSFKFQPTSSSTNKLGIIDIDYVIIPIYEIRQVRHSIRVGDTIE